jgi:hypothetical protein
MAAALVPVPELQSSSSSGTLANADASFRAEPKQRSLDINAATGLQPVRIYFDSV